MTLSSGSLKPIGVGIVGLSVDGGWAARGHLPALRAVDGFEVRGVSASSPQTAEKSAAIYGVPLAFGSAAELAAHEEIDLVVVAVKVPHHRELIIPALDAGKTVFSEWPLAKTLPEAEELAGLAERRGVRTAVGLQARSVPALRYLRDLIADGYVGEVLSTSMVASGGGWGPSVAGRTAYTADKTNGTTMLTVPFGHTLDAVTMVLADFASLNATTAVRRGRILREDTGELVPKTAEDQIAVTGVLESGAVASVHFRAGSSRSTNLLWEINGTDGDLVVTGESGHLQYGQYTLRGARGKDTGLAELPVPAEYTSAVSGVTGPALFVAHAYTQLRADLETGTSVVPDFAHAVHHHRLLARIERAAETGTRQ